MQASPIPVNCIPRSFTSYLENSAKVDNWKTITMLTPARKVGEAVMEKMRYEVFNGWNMSPSFITSSPAFCL